MCALSNWLRLISERQFLRTTQDAFRTISGHLRNYADTPKTDFNSKQAKAQGTENEERVRVRRARPADVPGVMRFVREHARTAWPGLVAPPSISHIVLCDYVARALAQGHSMLAEQQQARCGWTQIRGLALCAAVCPWDAAMLENWARCIRCTRSRRLMHFTAHCLRAPALHDKYRIHHILQVILIVPEANPKSSEIIDLLAKNTIQRGRDVGFPVLRFDVTDTHIAKSLEELGMKKEWHLSYGILPEILEEVDALRNPTVRTDAGAPNIKAESVKPNTEAQKKHFITVYTAFTPSGKR